MQKHSNSVDLNLPQLVTTIFIIPSLIFVLIVPESPRWLLTKNKEKKGIKVVEKMARMNKVVISEKTWNEARNAGEKVEKVKTILFIISCNLH